MIEINKLKVKHIPHNIVIVLAKISIIGFGNCFKYKFDNGIAVFILFSKKCFNSLYCLIFHLVNKLNLLELIFLEFVYTS